MKHRILTTAASMLVGLVALALLFSGGSDASAQTPVPIAAPIGGGFSGVPPRAPSSTLAAAPTTSMPMRC